MYWRLECGSNIFSLYSNSLAINYFKDFNYIEYSIYIYKFEFAYVLSVRIPGTVTASKACPHDLGGQNVAKDEKVA
jgi:hypothetical protein